MSKPFQIIEARAYRTHGLIVLEQDGDKTYVWRTFCRPWWDLLTWFNFVLTSGRSGWIVFKPPGYQNKVRVRAVRIAESVLRINVLER